MFGSLLIYFFSLSPDTLVIILLLIFMMIFIVGFIKIARAKGRMEFLLTTRHRDFLKSIKPGLLNEPAQQRGVRAIKQNLAGFSVQVKGRWHSYFQIFRRPEIFKELGDDEMVALAKKINRWRLPTAISFLLTIFTAGQLELTGTQYPVHEIYESGITNCYKAGLRRIKTVHPVYPFTRKSIFGVIYEPGEGWVQLKFVIDTDGNVKYPVVVKSASYLAEGKPGRDDFFVDAAITAVTQWKYGNQLTPCFAEIVFRFELED